MLIKMNVYSFELCANPICKNCELRKCLRSIFAIFGSNSSEDPSLFLQTSTLRDYFAKSFAEERRNSDCIFS